MARPNKLELNTEYPGPNEDELAQKIVAQLRATMEQRFLQGMTYRGVNTKSHAAVRAQLIVNPELPQELRVGLFREPRTYPAWIRFSSTLPDPLPDGKRDLRGLSIKLMEVDGEKLLPADRDGTTHDLIFITPDIFFTHDAEDFSSFVAAGGMDAHKTLSGLMKFLLFMLTHPATALCILRSQKRIGSLLEVPWYSATPYLFGTRAAKISLSPLQPAVTPVPPHPPNNYLREDLAAQLAGHDVKFSLRVQFQLDPYKQPIEDALVSWREQDSPWHTLATLVLPVQQVDSPEQRMFCENLSMNPWRCIAEHRPLGGVNRVRRRIYYEGSKHRHHENAVPVVEPTPSTLTEPMGHADQPARPVGVTKRRWTILPGWLPLPATLLGKVVSIVLVLAAVVAVVLFVIVYFPNLPAPVKVYDVVALNHNWSEPERQKYYHTSQGSEVMPYEWLMALEQPYSKSMFLTSDYISRLRFIPNPDGLNNPDLLPIGFAKDDPDPVTGVRNIGLTCALCHTAEMTYHGMGVRIDGAPGSFNFDNFLKQVVIAVGTTVQWNWYRNPLDPNKFDRFAKRVLKEQYSKGTADTLHKQVSDWWTGKVNAQLAQFGSNNASHQKVTAASYGRLDALGTGGNTLYSLLTNANLRVLNSPVTAYPLWYVDRYDWVQSNGSIRQPMSRNIIESVAVAASVVLPGHPGKDDQYVSSVRMKNMAEMEGTVGKLDAPAWPETIFGGVDQAKAAEGKHLYGQYCSSCHSPRVEPAPLCGDQIAMRNNKTFFMLRIYSLDKMGTDPLDASNFAQRRVDASAMGLGNDVPGPVVIQTVIGGILRRGFRDMNVSQAQQDQLSGFRADCWRAPMGYPARPLDGTWATAPYLHNNSVRSLYELLLPASQRAKKFHVGDPEFDPKEVGYVDVRIPGGFTVDTSKPGNSNAGHEFRNAPANTSGVIGPELTDEQRWALVEYLKVIDEMHPAIAAKDAAGAQPFGKCWVDAEFGACNAAPANPSSTPTPVSAPAVR